MPDEVGIDINGWAFAFAEDSLGTIWKSRFHVTDYDFLQKQRTPEQQAERERLIKARRERFFPASRDTKPLT